MNKIDELEQEIKSKRKIVTKRIEEFELIMKEAHINQTDKAGQPYYLHPLTVSSMCEQEQTAVVALLHDVLEDTNYSIDILKEKLTEEEFEALLLLTHKENVRYEEYVVQISKNAIARNVKICDLTHNSDLSRLKKTTEQDYKRREKYLKALEYLKKVEESSKKTNEELVDSYLSNLSTENKNPTHRNKHIKVLNN